MTYISVGKENKPTMIGKVMVPIKLSFCMIKITNSLINKLTMFAFNINNLQSITIILNLNHQHTRSQK